MEDIAELLKSTRENSNIDLIEVSNDLGIDELILKNIEEGHIGAFKDIFTLKNYLYDYSKYLGLDPDKIASSFNEYLFEYTSKIPVEEIEKTIHVNNKEKEDDEVLSPYTIAKKKSNTGIYVLIYVLVFVLVILAIYWSINQITVDKNSAYVVSYRK